MSRKNWKRAYRKNSEIFDLVGAALILAVILAILGLIYWFLVLDTREHKIVVQNATWRIDRQYQEYRSRRVHSTLSRSQLPRGAYNIRCDTDRWVDSDGNRHSDEDCDYTIDEWRDIDYIRTQGTRQIDIVVTPGTREYRVCETLEPDKGCEREVMRYRWRVYFTPDKGDVFYCDVQKWQWDDYYLIESGWKIKKNRLNGWLCNTIG